MIVWRACVVVAASSLTLIAQAPPRSVEPRVDAATIELRVVRADTGDPIRKARVSLSAGGRSEGQLGPAFTDDNGRLTFARVPPGRYQIEAAKAGFVMSRRTSASIEAAAGAIRPVEIRLPRAAAISGRIVDEFGEPVERASVSAVVLGRTERGTLNTTTAATATTDDRGDYRLARLNAGTYVVSVVVPQTSPGSLVNMIDRDGRVLLVRSNAATVRSYFPGGSSLGQAQPISLRAGEDRSFINMTAVVGAPLLPVLSVSFTDPRGAPAVATFAVLHNVDTIAPGFITHVLPDARSSAAMPIEPGEWSLYAQGASGEAAVARVVVGSSDTSLTVPLKPGGRITGRVISVGSPLPASAKVTVDAHLLDAGSRSPSGPGSRMEVATGGTFRLTNLAGLRDLRVEVPRGWALEAIRQGSRGLMGAPIDFKGGEELADVEVVLTDRVARVAGRVVNGLQAPAPDSSVLLLPDAPALRSSTWLRRVAEPDLAGRFAIDDLLPGSYLIVAVGDLDEFELGSADARARIRSRATPLTVGAIATTDVTVRVTD